MSAELHPPAETLADYAAGVLDEQRAEPVREHLAVCSHCTRIVLDLTGAVEPREDWHPDPQLGAAWRSHLERRARDKNPEVRDGSKDRARWRPSWHHLWQGRALPTVAALLLLALVLLVRVFAGWHWADSGKRETPPPAPRQPVIGLPGLELLPEGSLRTGEPEPRLAPPRKPDWFTLTLVLLDPSGLRRSGRYELEIYSSVKKVEGDDQPVWRGTGRLPEGPEPPPGHLTVVLPRELLPPGRFRLVLREPGSSGSDGILATYRFRLGPTGGADGRRDP